MDLTTEIEFGKKYRDLNTGFEGIATAVYFFQYGCSRVTLTSMVEGEIKEYTFDEQGLELAETAEPVKERDHGGPHDLVPAAEVRGPVCTRL